MSSWMRLSLTGWASIKGNFDSEDTEYEKIGSGFNRWDLSLNDGITPLADRKRSLEGKARWCNAPVIKKRCRM